MQPMGVDQTVSIPVINRANRKWPIHTVLVPDLRSIFIFLSRRQWVHFCPQLGGGEQPLLVITPHPLPCWGNDASLQPFLLWPCFFLVYALNSKSEGVLVADYSSSAPYYCYYLMKKKIKSDWSLCQGSRGQFTEPNSLGFSKADLDWEVWQGSAMRVTVDKRMVLDRVIIIQRSKPTR